MEGIVKEEPPDDLSLAVVSLSSCCSTSLHSGSSADRSASSFQKKLACSSNSSSTVLAGPAGDEAGHYRTRRSSNLNIKQEVDVDHNEEMSIHELPSKNGDILNDGFKSVSMPRNWNEVEKLKHRRNILHNKLLSPNFKTSMHYNTDNRVENICAHVNDQTTVCEKYSESSETDDDLVDENRLQIVLDDGTLLTDNCKSTAVYDKYLQEMPENSPVNPTSELLQGSTEHHNLSQKVWPGQSNDKKHVKTCDTYTSSSDLCELSASDINKSLQRAIDSIERITSFDCRKKKKQRLLARLQGKGKIWHPNICHYVVSKPSPKQSQVSFACRKANESILPTSPRPSIIFPIITKANKSHRKVETKNGLIQLSSPEGVVPNETLPVTENPVSNHACPKNTPPTKALLKKWLKRQKDTDNHSSEGSNLDASSNFNCQAKDAEVPGKGCQISKETINETVKCIINAQPKKKTEIWSEKMCVNIESNVSLDHVATDVKYRDAAVHSNNAKNHKGEEIHDQEYGISDEIVEKPDSVNDDKSAGIQSLRPTTKSCYKTDKYTFRKSKWINRDSTDSNPGKNTIKVNKASILSNVKHLGPTVSTMNEKHCTTESSKAVSEKADISESYSTSLFQSGERLDADFAAQVDDSLKTCNKQSCSEIVHREIPNLTVLPQKQRSGRISFKHSAHTQDSMPIIPEQCCLTSPPSMISDQQVCSGSGRVVPHSVFEINEQCLNVITPASASSVGINVSHPVITSINTSVTCVAASTKHPAGPVSEVKASKETTYMVAPFSPQHHSLVILSPDGRLSTVVNNKLKPIVVEINGVFHQVNLRNMHQQLERPTPVCNPGVSRKPMSTIMINTCMAATSTSSMQNATVSNQLSCEDVKQQLIDYSDEGTNLMSNACGTSTEHPVKCWNELKEGVSSTPGKYFPDELDNCLFIQNPNVSKLVEAKITRDECDSKHPEDVTIPAPTKTVSPPFKQSSLKGNLDKHTHASCVNDKADAEILNVISTSTSQLHSKIPLPLCLTKEKNVTTPITKQTKQKKSISAAVERLAKLQQSSQLSGCSIDSHLDVIHEVSATTYGNAEDNLVKPTCTEMEQTESTCSEPDQGGPICVQTELHCLEASIQGDQTNSGFRRKNICTAMDTGCNIQTLRDMNFQPRTGSSCNPVTGTGVTMIASSPMVVNKDTNQNTVAYPTDVLEQVNHDAEHLEQEQADLLRFPLVIPMAEQVDTDTDDESYDSIDLEKYEDARKDCDASNENFSSAKQHLGSENAVNFENEYRAGKTVEVIDTVKLKKDQCLTTSLKDAECHSKKVEVKEVGTKMYKALSAALQSSSTADLSSSGVASRKLIKTKFIILKGAMCDRWLEVKSATCCRSMNDANFIRYLLYQEEARQKEIPGLCACGPFRDEMSSQGTTNSPVSSHVESQIKSPEGTETAESGSDTEMMCQKLLSECTEASLPTIANTHKEVNTLKCDPEKTQVNRGVKRQAVSPASPHDSKRPKFHKLSNDSQTQVRLALSMFTDWMKAHGHDVLMTFKDKEWINRKFKEFCVRTASSAHTPHELTSVLKTMQYKFPNCFALEGRSRQNAKCSGNRSGRNEVSDVPEADDTTPEASRQGNMTTPVNDIITNTDFEKLCTGNTLSDENPVALLWKVWFDISYHIFRGSLHDHGQVLKKNSLELCCDSNGKYYKISEDVYRLLKLKINSSRMYATRNLGLKCPVRTLSLYLSHLNPNCEALFQLPRRTWVFATNCWYLPTALSGDELQQMMVRISKHAQLSRVYANQSVALTAEAKANQWEW